MPLREFTGNAIQVRLTGTLTAGETVSFTVDQAANGFPTGVTAPFVVVIDRGLASEEKILVATRTGATFNGLSRGHDNTTGVQHSAQAIVEHVISAEVMSELSLHVNDDNRDDHSQYLNLARHNDPVLHTIGGELPAATVFADAILPVGLVVDYAGPTEPTGWLFCNGQSFSGVTYPALAALLGGTNTPDLRGRVTVHKHASQTPFDTLFETGGTRDQIVVTHTHTHNAHTHTQNSHNHTQDAHSHTINAHTHTGTTDGVGNHDHSVDGDFGTRIVISHGAGVDRMNAAAGGTQTPITISTIDPNNSGAHSHTFTTASGGNNSNNSTATNQAATATNQNATTTENAQGSSGTDQNMQPYMVLNKIIKAA